MDITRLKTHHVQILTCISQMRKLAHAGVAENAAGIAAQLKSLGGTIVTHLAAEDRVLYPSVIRHPDPKMSGLAKRYQDEMGDLAKKLQGFLRKWSNPNELKRAPEEFRAEANQVLRAVHDRITRENLEFYPMVEAI